MCVCMCASVCVCVCVCVCVEGGGVQSGGSGVGMTVGQCHWGYRPAVL